MSQSAPWSDSLCHVRLLIYQRYFCDKVNILLAQLAGHGYGVYFSCQLSQFDLQKIGSHLGRDRGSVHAVTKTSGQWSAAHSGAVTTFLYNSDAVNVATYLHNQLSVPRVRRIAPLGPVHFLSPDQQFGIHCLIICGIQLLTPNSRIHVSVRRTLEALAR